MHLIRIYFEGAVFRERAVMFVKMEDELSELHIPPPTKG